MNRATPSPSVALALSTHPGPTVVVTAVTAVLAASAGLEGWRVALVSVAMLVGQVSVGLSNDWLDAHRDAAVGRTDKPIARGWVAAGTVRSTAFAAATLAVALTIPLGWLATVAHTVFIGSAWAYNVWLKRTVFSVVPYIVSFGLLPAVVTLSAADWRVAPWWALGAGALLGVAAHFANVLPDIADDTATGIAGLPHRVGVRVSGVVIGMALAAASVLVVVAPPADQGAGPGALAVAGLVLAVAAAVACAVLALRSAPTRLVFRFIMAGALVDVALLALSGSSL
jgi:4-hydroxybenzoate polyprenyltransferase